MSLKDKIKQPLSNYFSQLKSSIDEQIKPKFETPIFKDGNEVEKIKERFLSSPLNKIYNPPEVGPGINVLPSIGKTIKDITGGYENERIFAKIQRGERLREEEIERVGMSMAVGVFGALKSVGKNIGKETIKKVVPKVIKETQSSFQGLKNLSTKLLEKFRGMPEEITPQQFNEVVNRATKEGIRKADLDIVNSSLVKGKTGNINLFKTAARIEEQLVPLTPTPVKSPRYAGSQGTLI